MLRYGQNYVERGIRQDELDLNYASSVSSGPKKPNHSIFNSFPLRNLQQPAPRESLSFHDSEGTSYLALAFPVRRGRIAHRRGDCKCVWGFPSLLSDTSKIYGSLFPIVIYSLASFAAR